MGLSDKKLSSHTKKGFLERIGLRKSKKPVEEQHQHEEASQHHQETVDDPDEGEVIADDTDQTVTSSSLSSSTPARTSIDSNRSVPAVPHPSMSTNQRDGTSLLPHKGIPVKVKSKHKANQDWPPFFLAQTLTTLPRPTPPSSSSRRPSHDAQAYSSNLYGATWTMKFSKDGKYLASAGQFCNVYVWRVLDETAQDGENSIDVFEDMHYREYRGHLADNNFIVSASMDKTVRLWHVSREECLGVFPHLDVVTAVCFHPKDDRFFLSGSLDSRLRLWNVPEKKVAFWNEMQNGSMITSVAFTLDGKTACAGTHNGQCFFYETQGLKYNTQINIRFGKRTSKKSRKITGIEPMPGTLPGDERILITSNDSQARLYNMKDKSLMYKYKGPHNLSMQIRSSFSDDGQHIVCGSEDGNVYIWVTQPVTYSPFHLWPSTEVALSRFDTNDEHLVPSTQQMSTSPRMTSWLKRGGERRGAHQDKLRIQSDFFEAHQHITTVAVFAPARTRQALAKSNHDIIYNHTPLDPALEELRRRRWKAHTHEEMTLMRRSFSGGDHLFRHAQDLSSDEEDDEELDIEDWNTLRDNYNFPNGHIIVSANDTGCIKVWRMDSGVYDGSVNVRSQQQQKRSPKACHRKSNSLELFVNHGTSTQKSADSSRSKRPHLGHLFSSVGRSSKP
ncbi:hypothetical protein LRAMOSA02632 [Lichtheimia ramosa]|uniref:Uncharacterized protein n=1 Tax=Lichtheimia ramosa TaxID=688394 RepID=A0A077WRI8_9FUNG|nr:hypothetical protein LRAMOSA02632 [Lichtheimia ramosa]